MYTRVCVREREREERESKEKRRGSKIVYLDLCTDSNLYFFFAALSFSLSHTFFSWQ